MDKRELVKWIEQLIELNQLDRFYHSKYFRKVKREVLRELHYECVMCKAKGKLTIIKEDRKRSGVLHHVKEVRQYPELALSKYYIDDEGNKQRNLIPLCDPHHEEVHDRYCTKEPLNIERW